MSIPDCGSAFEWLLREHPIIAGVIGALVGGLLVGLIALFIWWAVVRWRKYGKLFCFKSRARHLREEPRLVKPIDEFKKGFAQDVEPGLKPGQAKPNDKPALDAGAKNGLADAKEEALEVQTNQQLK